MLLTAISEAVERYNPESEAVVRIEREKGFEVSIVSVTGCPGCGRALLRSERKLAPHRSFACVRR